MLILLTGENGFLGRELKIKLNKNYTLLKKKKEKRYIVNLKNLDQLEKFLNIHKPDLIINAAVLADFNSKQSADMMKVNYFAVKKFVDYCYKNKKKLIQISGTIVHPKMKKYDITSELETNNFYGLSKLKADKYIIKKKIDFKIIRFGGIFGLRGPDHLFINKVLKSNKKYINFEGNYYAKRNYIHVSSAADCVEKLINIKRKGIYYAGGITTTFSNMLKQICNKKNIKLNLKLKKNDIDEIVISNKIFKSKKFEEYI